MKRFVAALVASGALAAGAFATVAIVGAPAIAQESTPTPDSSQSPEEEGSGAPSECDHGLTALMEDGTITQAQADAIKEALSAARESGQIPAPGEGAREAKIEAMRAVLAKLVSAGTITQAQADAVIAAKGRHGPDSSGSSAEGAFFRPLFGTAPSTT